VLSVFDPGILVYGKQCPDLPEAIVAHIAQELQMLQTQHHLLVVKDPAIQAAILVLMAIFTIAWMVGFWVNTGVIRDARESGHRYWLINPLAMLAGYRQMNWKIYLWYMFVGLPL
jgi:hypothetical protein